MDLNYLAFGLIAFVPLIIACIWYQPEWSFLRWSGINHKKPSELSFLQMLWCFIMSFALVFGYINLIIHQMGFYELFFTDIMKGSMEAQHIVDDFLGKYGDKHRHFGHGFFHGAINAFVFALPFISIQAILNEKNYKTVIFHFGYWLITSAVIGGLISEFV